MKRKRCRVNRTSIQFEMKTKSRKQTNFHTGLGMAIRYEMKTVSCKQGLRIKIYKTRSQLFT